MTHDIVTTFHWPLRDAWMRRAVTVDPDELPVPRVVGRVARLARDARAVVLDGSVGPSALYRDLAAAALIARRRRPPAVVIADCTWKLSSARLDRLACRAGISLIDGPHVTYCVHSTAEHEMFPDTWGVPRERVAVTLWPFTVPDEDVVAPPPGDGTVFAGGNSLRDYDTLLAAAAAVPARFTVATTTLSERQLAAAPPNVDAGALAHDEYVARMEAAGTVVVPMAGALRRSAGQTTYVNAMALGKLVVVTAMPGVDDYVEDRVTGLVVPPRDPVALRDTLRWAVDPANAAAVQEIRARGRAVALERLSPERYVERMLEVVDATVARLS